MKELNGVTDTITSLEIAELTGRRHTGVRRGIQRLAEELEWEIIGEDDLGAPPGGGAIIVEKQIVMPSSGKQAL